MLKQSITQWIHSIKLNHATIQHYVTNDNDYFIDVTNLGHHNKDFTLVTQASILFIYNYTAIEHKTLYDLRVHSCNIPQRNSCCNCRNQKAKATATTANNNPKSGS